MVVFVYFSVQTFRNYISKFMEKVVLTTFYLFQMSWKREICQGKTGFQLQSHELIIPIFNFQYINWCEDHDPIHVCLFVFSVLPLPWLCCSCIVWELKVLMAEEPPEPGLLLLSSSLFQSAQTRGKEAERCIAEESLLMPKHLQRAKRKTGWQRPCQAEKR